ncbi:ABC transporter ATP-binding protein [Nocardioides pocheonensis]|uniref:ABC transporter ATP-binding protein n=1 Tax=Nocardioides pocheonensis TaxID=661485 RepID=A0A3N0GWT5_9ACTN|nr:ABC transporter ATP-binding protein [Nocardioides pocheonensis]RNM16618.1 ABC transporter ATP-binding protein [Nocardioides pocheonensis]
MSSAIELDGVRQVFHVRDRQGRRQQFVALEGLDLSIRAGELFVLVGPSGCGKSTVLDLISGLNRPAAGSIRVGDRVVDQPGLDRGFVFQQYTLLPWRTAQGNVEFALEAAGGLSRRERRERARQYLDLVGLDEFADRYPHELSGGMKQRVAIARSLSYEPEVLLMDEPYGALDAQTRERLQRELLAIWRRTGTTIVFITHDIDEAVFLGQRVGVMSSRPGRIKAVVDIDLDRDHPDQDVRSTPEFARHRHQVWSLLRSDLETVDDPARAEAEEVGRVA